MTASQARAHQFKQVFSPASITVYGVHSASVHVPMGRLPRSEEIARAALFLASDDSSYVNGATFVVDDGPTAASVTPE